MKRKIKINKNILNLVLIVSMFIALFSYMVIVDGWANIVIIVKQIEPIWFVAAGLLLVTYWILEAVVLHIVTKKVCKKERFRNSLRVSMIGQLFRNITPFSSGGQPMQAIAMVKSGVSVTSSATILLVKFIIYQTVLVLYTTVIIIFKYEYFKELVSSFITLSIIGFAMNLAVIISLIMVGVNKDFVYGILKTIYKYLDKIGFMKNVDKKLESLKENIDIFHEEFKIIRKEKMMILRAAILTMVQLTAESTITYAVYRAFGENTYSLIDVVSAQTFLFMIMAFIPTPGAGGAAEGGFYVIFKTFFAQNEIKMAILFWRIYTFYLPILVGAIFLLLKPKNKVEVIEVLKEQAKEIIETQKDGSNIECTE